jgi:integrase
MIAEVDWKRFLWTIPASCMKSHRKHVIPLGERLMPIRTDAMFGTGAPSQGNKVFTISDTAMRRLCRQTAGKPITLHGFRSSFRDWCAETGVRRELAEAALAHTVKDKTEAAYARSTLVEQRREVMEKWWAFVYGS